ncbi:glutaminase [Corynebacterium tuscaniense DNF00037]|nr:glutaminase [Corynebacterium tuscaniense]KGF23405.1 glutaminase [Corynebacterium tuscaniense DNF00037]
MPRSPIPSYLTAILDEVRPNTDGANADYIEGLRNADPDKLALAVCTRSGHLYSVGDDEYEFTIQSISKPFVYAVALDQLGEDKVHNHVGVEPSGEAFNELSLDRATHRPANPMINAGAIAVNRMVGDDAAILSAFSRLAGRTLTVDESILQGELATADRNLALAHMLREYGMITGDVHDAVESYTRQCSILVTVRDLAVMAATLANGGLQPVTGERVLSTKACRLTQAVMASCGMYDGSGRWMSSVGIPAKSGVAGGLIGTLPGQLGAASLSPRLNSEGNSVRGVDIFQSLSSTLGLHMMASNYYSAPGIRAVHRKGETNIVELQGMINFIAAETILHDLVERKLVGDNLVLDFRHVTSFNLAGRRLVKEGLRQFREDGFDVAVYDPASAMPDYEFSDGTKVDSIQDVSESFELTVTPEEAYTALAEPEVDFDVAEDETGDRLVWHSADEEWAESDIIFDFGRDSEGATTVEVTHRGLTPRYEEAAEHWRGEIRKRLKPLTQQD